MPTLLPEIESALVASAARLNHRRSGWRSPRRGGALAIALALVAGSALAAIQPWRPLLGTNDLGHPSTSTAPLPPDQLARLAVLRRPQSPGDRQAPIPRMLTYLDGHHISGVHVEGIRVLDRRSAGIAVLVPVEQEHLPSGATYESARRGLLCLMFGSETGVALSCGTSADLEAGRMAGSAQFLSRPAELFGLVPDGVASVGITYPDGTTSHAAITNNAYVIEEPSAAQTAGAPQVRWLDASGKDTGPDAAPALTSSPHRRPAPPPSRDPSLTVTAPDPATATEPTPPSPQTTGK